MALFGGGSQAWVKPNSFSRGASSSKFCHHDVLSVPRLSHSKNCIFHSERQRFRRHREALRVANGHPDSPWADFAHYHVCPNPSLEEMVRASEIYLWFPREILESIPWFVTRMKRDGHKTSADAQHIQLNAVILFLGRLCRKNRRKLSVDRTWSVCICTSILS